MRELLPGEALARDTGQNGDLVSKPMVIRASQGCGCPPFILRLLRSLSVDSRVSLHPLSTVRRGTLGSSGQGRVPLSWWDLDPLISA